MKLRTTLMAAIASLGMIGAANAVPLTGQIALGGSAAASGSASFGGATGIDFVMGTSGTTGPAAGGINFYGSGTGSFAALGSCANAGGTCGTIKDLANFTAPVSGFLTLASTPGVTFDITSFASVGHDVASDTLFIVANGIIHENGFDDTAGQFKFSAQGALVNSFSATTLATAVPEPASLAILGGSLAALGLLRRKKA